MGPRVENRMTIFRWTKSTFYGWILGIILIVVLSSFLDSLGIEDMQLYIGMAMGVGVGLTQWLLLRKFYSINANWVLVSAVGLSFPFVAVEIIKLGVPDYKLPLCVSLGSILVGLLQLPMTRKIGLKTEWIFLCFLGWTLAASTVMLMNYTMTLRGQASGLILALLNFVFILAGGVILGLVTGIVFRKNS
jgi:hypothetical protein